jgi:NADH-quinone oxidoreductase subunit E
MATETTTEFSLSPEAIQAIDELVPQYPQTRSAVLMVLHAIQEEKGYLSKAAVEWTAERLELEPINVWELVTFYPMFRTEAPGKRIVRVCRTLSCALKGAYLTSQTLQKELNCPLNGNSEDGEFTLEFSECLADCGNAPIVMVDEEHFTHVTPAAAVELAAKLKKT